jgi:hypothetical protein
MVYSRTLEEVKEILGQILDRKKRKEGFKGRDPIPFVRDLL